MSEGKELKVIIKKSGQVFYGNKLIAILGEWNKYEDLVSEIPCEKGNK